MLDIEERMKKWQKLHYLFTYKDLTGKPKIKTAILTCMDCRIISSVFGVEEPGEVIIIRNAGALLTEDSLRSLLIAIYELDVRIIIVVGHTQCGGCMDPTQMNNLIAKISEKTGRTVQEILPFLNAPNVPAAFRGFIDVRKQVQKTAKTISRHPLFVPLEIKVYAYIYNTTTGELLRSLYETSDLLYE
ncbi:beta-class carbonic anhydrase [Candidatus Hodarchaeum mangrovi]